MRLIYSMGLILALAFSQAWVVAAASTTTNDGVFTSVSGKVQAKKRGKKSRTVKNGSTVKAGERITTSKNGKAVLRFFDGSELKVSPKTVFTIAKMEKVGAEDKLLKFKLAAGDLWASVKKLTSSKSSFEIESGGVVCGVRGTKYNYQYDPETHQVKVEVTEGTVYINSNGHTYLFTAGQSATFDNGQPAKAGDQSNDDGKDHGSLADLNQQFGIGLVESGDNSFTDPLVEGSAKVSVHAVVPPGEAP